MLVGTPSSRFAAASASSRSGRSRWRKSENRRRRGPDGRASRVYPARGTTLPSSDDQADSSARTTVVPIATTRRPSCARAFTASAVSCGHPERLRRQSCAASTSSVSISSDDTPVCKRIVAMPIPRRAARRRRPVVNGRAAVGISAEPGAVAKIVWYAVERLLAVDVAVADRLPAPRHRAGEVAFDEPQPLGPRVRRDQPHLLIAGA